MRPYPFRLLLVLLASAFAVAHAQTAPAPADPVAVPTPGGRVVSPSAALHHVLYDTWHIAPARVEGDLVYLSGIVASAPDGRPVDAAGLEALHRRAWAEVRAALEAAGSGTDALVELTTFHVFHSPFFRGTKREQIEVYRRVKNEFVPPPYPVSTAVGISELFPDGGLFEIRVVARLKSAPAAH